MSAPTEPQSPGPQPEPSLPARARAKAASVVPPRYRPVRKVAWGLYASTLAWFLIDLVTSFGVTVPASAAAAITPLIGFGLAYLVRNHKEDTILFEPDWDDDAPSQP